MPYAFVSLSFALVSTSGHGTGSGRRCTAGMLVGVTATLADLSNAGAKAVRLVRVQVLRESVP